VTLGKTPREDLGAGISVGLMSEDLGEGEFGAKPLESWRSWTAKKRQKTSTNIAENNETLSHCVSHSAVFLTLKTRRAA
jgi:hypothetical protein